jgi:hypothetical protein
VNRQLSEGVVPHLVYSKDVAVIGIGSRSVEARMKTPLCRRATCIVLWCGLVWTWATAEARAACGSEQAALVASEASVGAAAGASISIDRDVIVVGAPTDEVAGVASGSAYVFHRDKDGCWRQQARLTGSATALLGRFGESVAIDRGAIAVGTPFDAAAGVASGSVYVFESGAGGWTEHARLTAWDATENLQFGTAVAISGDTLAVGAAFDGEAARNAGAVYVFRRVGGRWTPAAKLTASDAQDFDFLGSAVAIDGNTLVAGAPGRTAAYIFARGPVWQEQARLSSPGNQFDQFGSSVAIDAERIVIGAPGDDEAAFDGGAAYVFEQRAGWSVWAKLLAPDAEDEDEFGHAVALLQATIVVGAPFEGERNEGAVYVFRRSSSWTARRKLVSEASHEAFFGAALAIDGGTVAVGAPSFVHFDGTCCTGTAHAFSVR